MNKSDTIDPSSTLQRAKTQTSTKNDQVSSLLSAYLSNPVNPVVGHSSSASATNFTYPLNPSTSPSSTTAINPRSVAPVLTQSSPLTHRPPNLDSSVTNILTPSLQGQATSNVIETSSPTYGPIDPTLLNQSIDLLAPNPLDFPNSSSCGDSRDPDGFAHDRSTTLSPRSLSPNDAMTTPFSTHRLKSKNIASISPDRIAGESGEGLDPFKVPEVDMSVRRRAPRKCGVCGQYYCKGGHIIMPLLPPEPSKLTRHFAGRGNRTLCPGYVPGRDDSSSFPYKAPLLFSLTSPASLHEAIIRKKRILPASGSRESLRDPSLTKSSDDIHVNHAINTRTQSDPSWSKTDWNPSETLDPVLQSPQFVYFCFLPPLSRFGWPPLLTSSYNFGVVSNGKVRKRGPRRCAVCGQMSCPGNGNRKHCSTLKKLLCHQEQPEIPRIDPSTPQ